MTVATWMFGFLYQQSRAFQPLARISNVGHPRLQSLFLGAPEYMGTPWYKGQYRVLHSTSYLLARKSPRSKSNVQPPKIPQVADEDRQDSNSTMLTKKKPGTTTTTTVPAVKPSSSGKTYRADRVLSNRGWGSRSECFELLQQRRVVQRLKTGQVLPILGPSEKIAMDADLWIDNKVQVPMPPPLLRVYHKPKWVLSVMNDGKGRKHLGELDFIHKMHPVGRLDYDTSGLLLFSSDGTLTQKLLHPSNGVPKEYVALVVGTVNKDELRDTLAAGVTTTSGTFPAQLLDASPIPSEQVRPLIDEILNNLPPEYEMERLEEKGYLFFKDAQALSTVRLVVEEGKHRMVRRMLANCGFPVIGLKRERLGIIRLNDLEEGSYRELSKQELQWANALKRRKLPRNADDSESHSSE